MRYYFLVIFKGNKSIFIIRVDDYESTLLVAERAARRIVENELHDAGDFEIKQLMLEDLISKLHFVDDIAELMPVTHP